MLAECAKIPPRKTNSIDYWCTIGIQCARIRWQNQVNNKQNFVICLQPETLLLTRPPESVFSCCHLRKSNMSNVSSNIRSPAQCCVGRSFGLGTENVPLLVVIDGSHLAVPTPNVPSGPMADAIGNQSTNETHRISAKRIFYTNTQHTQTIIRITTANDQFENVEYLRCRVTQQEYIQKISSNIPRNAATKELNRNDNLSGMSHWFYIIQNVHQFIHISIAKCIVIHRQTIPAHSMIWLIG